ncbi:hypothetical protein SAMN05661093_05750 [Kibdelosporangium aridum]|uniref:Histidine kinase n=1 Tax=Kibdelosporangium aridum TaxID=2030 RepID=A0A1Y5XYE7_KIBAR|nr:hypothetical protein SAMN05661093_05750 [Kibdelosporangium aridum]
MLELHEPARRYAAVWKVAVIVPTSVLAPFTDDRPAILVAASVVLTWSVAGFVLLRHQPRVTLAVDVAVAVADLYVIRDSRRFAATNAVNLVPVLTDLCGDARFSGPPGPVLLPAHQAEAICGAVTEALMNVRRHAGDVAAEVTLSADGGMTVIAFPSFRIRSS